MANLIFITRFFYKFFGKNMAVVLGLTFLAVLFEGLGIAAFFPIIQGLESDNRVGKILEYGFQSIGLNYSIGNILMFLSVLFMIKALVMIFQSVYVTKLMTNLAVDYRLKVLKGIFNMPYESYLKESSGYFNNAMTMELQRAMFSFLSFCSMLTSGAFAVLHLVFPLLMNPALIVVLLVAGLPVYLLMKSLHRKVKKVSIDISRSSGEVQKSVIEVLNGYKYLKSTYMYPKILCQIHDKARKLSGYQIQQKIFSSIPAYGLEPVIMIIISCFIFYLLVVKGGSLMTHGFILLLMFSSLKRFAGLQDNYNKLIGAFGSLLVLEEIEKKIEPCTSVTRVSHREAKFDQDLSFKNVHFQYLPDTPVLTNINMQIKPFSTVAIIGSSGSGKTTLVNLLVKMISPHQGNIYLGSSDYNDFQDADVQAKLGYVTQENIIFKETLWNNLTFFAPYSQDLEQKLKMLLEQLQLQDFLNKLPEGLDTVLSESGLDISGGQRQRLFLVRELLKDPVLLILDEATSALDSGTEEKINQYLLSIKGKKTLVIIAHRLSTIKNADVIHIMDKGSIRESGSFEELIKNSALFNEMVSKQALV